MQFRRAFGRSAGAAPACILLVAFAPSLAILVGRAPQAAAQDPLPPAFSGAAKIVETGEAAIHVVNEKSEEFYVQIEQATVVTLAGAIEESFLAPGTVVRFTADFDEKGMIKADISSLTVVELSVVVQAGVFRDGDPTIAAAEKGKKKASAAGTYMVVGQVKSFKKGSLHVQAPGAKLIKAKLATDAKLEIDVTSYGLARPGDEITIEGSLMQESRVAKNKVQPGIIKARKIDIKPAEPLNAQSRKKGKGNKQTKGKEKGKEKSKGKPKPSGKAEKTGENAKDGEVKPAAEQPTKEKSAENQIPTKPPTKE